MRGGRIAALIRTGFSIADVAIVLWLVAAEVLIIGHVCPRCTGAQLVTVSILLVLTRSTPDRLGFEDAASRQRSSEAHPPAASWGPSVRALRSIGLERWVLCIYP